MQATGPHDQITISGNIQDEIGVPLAQARLILGASITPGAFASWTTTGACKDTTQLAPRATSDGLVVEADHAGQFCVVGGLSGQRAVLRADFAGDWLHDGTRTEILWDALQQTALLAFDPPVHRLDLSAPTATVLGRLTNPPVATQGARTVLLEDHDGKRLGEGTPDGLGVVLFHVPTSALAGPAIADLRLRFPGAPDLAATSIVASVTRFLPVHLIPEHGEIWGNPDDALSLVVRAVTARGPAKSGTAEAVIGTQTVGVAPIADGTAKITIHASSAGAAALVPVVLRYVSDAPFYETDPRVTTVLLHPKRPHPLVRFVPVLLALFVAAWLLRGWRRPKRLDRAGPAPRVPSGAPAVAVIAPLIGETSWRGLVVDAHDGSSIAGARITAVAPSFVELDVVAQATSDDHGRFRLEVRSVERELRLRVESPFHVHLERPLPAPSELVIALASRRRVLLDRLAGWARREGRPWDEVPEATPGHVVRVASTRDVSDPVAQWARSVEHKAFGSKPVLSADEREVCSMEPKGTARR